MVSLLLHNFFIRQKKRTNFESDLPLLSFHASCDLSCIGGLLVEHIVTHGWLEEPLKRTMLRKVGLQMGASSRLPDPSVVHIQKLYGLTLLIGWQVQEAPNGSHFLLLGGSMFPHFLKLVCQT